MRVVCVSDTHSLLDQLHARSPIPDGDVLVHADDFTSTGDRNEVIAFNAFLGRIPHRYKIVIAGNHDTAFDRQFYPQHWWRLRHSRQYDPDEVRGLLTNALYLEDQTVMIEGFKFYGWGYISCLLIPIDTDVLITHGPPFGILDEVDYHGSQGCEELVREVVERVKPQLHVFGHIHEGYGTIFNGTTLFVNVSSCTVNCAPINPALVFDLRPSKLRNQTDTALEYDIMFARQLVRYSQKSVFVQQSSS